MDDNLRSFDVNGFVALPQFLNSSELDELWANLARFIEEVVPSLPRECVFYEDRRDSVSLKQIQRMGDVDPWFEQLFTAGKFRKTAEQLLRGPVVPKNLQYFNKPPGIGRPTPPHQDGYYFMLRPCEAVTMWLALDDADEENGCVRYVRGSHQAGFREHHRTDTLGFSQGIAGYPSEADTADEVAMPASPGDLLVHHAMTIHRADGNGSTARSRRALGFIYYGERAVEDAGAVEAYQSKLAHEMKANGKI